LAEYGKIRGVKRRLALLALGWAIAAAPALAAGETVHFHFARPDGDREVETLVMTREKDLGALGKVVDRQETRTSLSYRREKGGYAITARVLSTKTTRDGQAMSDPMSEALRHLTLVYHVGPEARLTRIDGLGGVLDTLKAHFPPELVKSLEPMVTPRVLFAREAAEWTGRYQFFVERTFEIGQRIVDESPFVLPNGDTLSYRTVTTIAGREPCGGDSCVRVETEYDSKAGALDRFTTEAAGQMTRATQDSTAVSTSGSRVSGTLSRLVAPRTLRIHSEKATRITHMTITVAGHDPVAMVMTETRERSYAPVRAR
jgi:hypothetical protein